MTFFKLFALLFLVKVCLAYPRYVAIPLEDLQNYGIAPSAVDYPVEVNRRLQISDPRYDVQIDEEEDEEPSEIDYERALRAEEEEEEQRRLKRSEFAHRGGGHGGGGHDDGGDDKVDYGAYTGGHGAFGWYSDHPVGGGGGGKKSG